MTFFQVKGRPCNCGNGPCQAGDEYMNQFEEVVKYTLPKGPRYLTHT